ncbi:MAG: hypothetical protein A3F61_02525 [Candidatus Blackburnbacteria bacterium RIFCSPHIGHO2_12_FULL_41_13b]|uniref:Uncharacterized protein n=1 Tax=Candidatus Blackburnbacteria bacterium RIFCSPHIGHO2_12_FULL_41_13b TaxID=1797517 RepID=A0A1G1VCB5_9BACT|nr:MAG: hypothetical protein A3F61_02525 [Candidatus Blackburnbacteria bacterium RIFCSPHIGHO2_12_FULL_41_13b]
MNIFQFDALIHPDFLLRERMYQNMHPTQVELHNRWGKRFQEIADDPTTALLYYSSYNKLEFDGQTIPKNKILFPLEKKRIELLNELLGDRFINFNSGDFPYKPLLMRIFEQRGFLFTPAETTLRVYGEIYEACVNLNENSWGAELKKALGIPESNYHPDPELSLIHPQVLTIESWQASKEGGGIPIEKGL